MSDATSFQVLYIDDDQANGSDVPQALARHGYEVVRAAGAEAGLARLAAGGFDAIVLDHRRSPGAAMDVLAALAGRDGVPPVVYVADAADTAAAVAALDAGAADYVPRSGAAAFAGLLSRAIDHVIFTARLEAGKTRAERELREAGERAELLLREVNHRVANSLQLVAALVRMQANAVAEPAARDALSETQARISAIAGVHRQLYTWHEAGQVDVADYLSSLVTELEASMREAGNIARLDVHIADVRVSTDKAVSLGVIVTELVTNAVKYAYPPESAGEVRVRVKTPEPGRCELAVEDDGVGWDGTGPAKGSGIGSRIVSAMATNLGSEVRYLTPGRGTRAEIRFAL